MNKWISVKEKLPALGEEVLCFFEDGSMAVGYCYPLYEMWMACTGDNFRIDMDGEPIYWMPLPKPPIKEDCND